MLIPSFKLQRPQLFPQLLKIIEMANAVGGHKMLRSKIRVLKYSENSRLLYNKKKYFNMIIL